MKPLLVLFAVAWVFAAIGLPPIEDETYYWAWSRAPALTYFDHPPGIAWVMTLSTRALGDGVLGLRAPSAVAVATILAFTVLTARALRARADLAILILLGAPMFTVGYVPGTHDVLLGAAAALAAYAIVAYPRGTAAAFLLTVSLLLKHAAAVIALGALLGVASTRDGRAALRHWRPWAGLALGLLVVSPWIYADLTNGESIAFQATHVFAYGKIRGPVALPLAIGSTLLTLGPVGGAAIWLATLDTLKDRENMARSALAGGALAILAACVVAVWAGSGEANWPMPALAFSAPLLAAWIGDRPRVERVARPAAWLTAVIGLLLMVHAGHPLFHHPRDPTLRGAGFDAIADRASALATEHHAKMIVTTRYQAASLVRYHTRDAHPVLELGNKRRKSQYDLWPRPPVCAGEAYVWVGPSPGPPPELGGESLAEPIAIRRRRTPDSPVIDTWWAHALRAERDRECASGPGLLEP